MGDGRQAGSDSEMVYVGGMRYTRSQRQEARSGRRLVGDRKVEEIRWRW